MTLLSQMHHPNIVKYITSFTDKPMANAGSKDKSLYIVMEVAMQKRLLPAFARKFMCARSHCGCPCVCYAYSSSMGPRSPS